MIIIKSQSGNISNIVHVELDESGTAIFGLINKSRVQLLGQGYSEERAKEVMKEIENHIEFLHQEHYCRLANDNYYSSVPNKIFEMPQE